MKCNKRCTELGFGDFLVTFSRGTSTKGYSTSILRAYPLFRPRNFCPDGVLKYLEISGALNTVEARLPDLKTVK